MEIDYLEVVDLWNTRSFRSVVAPILLEIWDLSSSFSYFVIQHVPRSSNLSAHLCAKQASTLDVTECWMDSIPSLLVTSLSADSAGAVSVE